MTNHNYTHYKQTDGSWTALVSLDGLEVITNSANCRKLYRRIKPGHSFIMKIRPLVQDIDYLCDRLNALRNISKELAFKGLDFLVNRGLIEIVWMTTGDEERDAYIDREARHQFGVVFER
jgi:hypothetical protein